MLLEENGYRAQTATNGSDAVEAFMSHSVDLVVIDYHMPGMNGAMAAARMKNSKPQVPIMLVSGDEHVPPSDLEAVDCFLSKSGSITGFLEKVDYLLSLRFLFRPFGILETESAGNPKNQTGFISGQITSHLFEK